MRVLDGRPAGGRGTLRPFALFEITVKRGMVVDKLT